MASDGKVTVTSGTFSSDAVTGSGGGFGGTGGNGRAGSTGPGTSGQPGAPGGVAAIGGRGGDGGIGTPGGKAEGGAVTDLTGMATATSSSFTSDSAEPERGARSMTTPQSSCVTLRLSPSE